MLNQIIRWYQEIGLEDLPQVGGKNASLGEMIANLGSVGVQVPGGFATTAEAYREFLAHKDLDKRINTLLDTLDVENVVALAEAGSSIRQWILDTPLPATLEQSITDAYQQMQEKYGSALSVAVRSLGQLLSATEA